MLSFPAVLGAVRVFPWVPASHVEDAFVTGILGRILGLDFFAAASGLFTHMEEVKWRPVELMSGWRVLGTGLLDPRQFWLLWATLLDTEEQDRPQAFSPGLTFLSDRGHASEHLSWRTLTITDLLFMLNLTKSCVH